MQICIIALLSNYYGLKEGVVPNYKGYCRFTARKSSVQVAKPPSPFCFVVSPKTTQQGVLSFQRSGVSRPSELATIRVSVAFKLQSAS